MQITEHFSEEELEHTDTGLENACPEPLKANALRLAETVLEPARTLLGPLHINSWYRSPSVNRAVGGEAKSAHMEARAADIVPNGDVFKAFKMLVANHSMIPYDRIIHEQRHSQWIHIQVAPEGQQPLGLALLGRPDETGKIIYSRFEE